MKSSGGAAGGMEEPGHSQRELPFHSWMMRMEMIRLCDYSFRLMLRVMPGLIEAISATGGPRACYRKIFVLNHSRPLPESRYA